MDYSSGKSPESVYLHSRAPLHLQSRRVFWEEAELRQSKHQPAGPLAVNGVHGEVSSHKNAVGL